MDETARWVLENYSHLLTEQERAAHRALLVRRKISNADSPQEKNMLGRWASSDPEVLRLLADGEDKFAESVRERVFRERKGELNFCPRCGALARTPRAKQCPKCFHSWHEDE